MDAVLVDVTTPFATENTKQADKHNYTENHGKQEREKRKEEGRIKKTSAKISFQKNHKQLSFYLRNKHKLVAQLLIRL